MAPDSNPVVRLYRAPDLREWVRMRLALWPEEDSEDAERDAQAWVARENAAVFVAERTGTPRLCGFAEVGLRPYADGCDSSPVAFLEGWYVDSDVRGRGTGAALVSAAETWARARGLREFASDALLENTASHAAHRGCGFEEVERAVRFRKSL